MERLEHFGKKTKKSQWAFEDSLASWTWDGFEGKPVVVDVYVQAAIRSTRETGEIRVTFNTEGCEPLQVILRAEN